jgi:phosphoenolpyruvate-protein phosphotransferase
MKTFAGVTISPGYAEGPIHVHRPAAFEAPERRTIAKSEVAGNLKALRQAMARAKEDLEKAQGKLAGNMVDPSAAHIFHAHLLILDDPAWVDEIEKRVREEHLEAISAVQEVTEVLAARFAGMKNAYLRERTIDLHDVARRVMIHLSPKLAQPLADLGEPSILVAKSLLPSDMVHLDRMNTLAIVTEEGGVSDHVAVVTRSLGIPGVTGVKGITQQLSDGAAGIVDGHGGKLLVAVSEGARRRYQALIRREVEERHALEALRDEPAVTLDGHRVALWANIGDSDDAKRAKMFGAEAIGLFRTELNFLQSIRHPTESAQLQAYRSMAKAAGNVALTIRTLDLGGDKQLNYAMDAAPESNPLLGRRGIRRSLEEPKVLRRQIRALLRLAADHEVRILLPMIVSVSDVVRTREEIAIASGELQRAGREHRADVPVGIMVETPAAVMIIEDLLPHCDFVSVGTNDLIQYLLVADRADPRTREHHTLLHPAVLRALRSVSVAAREADVPLCLCGELAGFPGMTSLLLGLGYTTLSVVPAEIPRLKREIRALRLADCEQLAEDTVRMSMRGAIEGTVQARHSPTDAE